MLTQMNFNSTSVGNMAVLEFGTDRDVNGGAGQEGGCFHLFTFLGGDQLDGLLTGHSAQ